MTSKVKKTRRWLYLFLSVVMAFGITSPLLAVNDSEKAYANTGDTVTIDTTSDPIYYGEDGFQKTRIHKVTATTADMGDEEGRVTYCLQPSLLTPPDGTYTISNILTDDATGTNSTLRKILYYSPGFPGYYKGGQDIYDSVLSGEHNYVKAHLLLSYIYGKDPDVFLGAESWRTPITSLKSQFLALDDPPESFRAFMISVSGYQDQIGGYFEETGYVTLTKTSTNTDITEGNSCYSLAGAQYGNKKCPDTLNKALWDLQY